jgi:hypothetical protein
MSRSVGVNADGARIRAAMVDPEIREAAAVNMSLTSEKRRSNLTRIPVAAVCRATATASADALETCAYRSLSARSRSLRICDRNSTGKRSTLLVTPSEYESG